MDEYQDQAAWFEVQRKSGPDYGWIMVTTADSREAAEEWIRLYDPRSMLQLRVVRRTGLDA